VDDSENRKIKLLEQIVDNTFDTNVLLGKILAALTKQTDIAGFIVSNSTPVKQKGDTEMAGKVVSLGAPGTQAMLDDQKNVMSIAPVNSQGLPTSLASGVVPTYTVAPGTFVKLGTPAADGLSIPVSGIPGSASAGPSVDVVTASYTNPDGSIATATDTYTITDDPAELDVAGFTVTNSTPVAQ